MPKPLFVILAEALAETAPGYRSGARHAMIFIVQAADLEKADAIVRSMAREEGWNWLEVRKRAKLDPRLERMKDGLRDAVEEARRSGRAMIVYRDEIPLDS